MNTKDVIVTQTALEVSDEELGSWFLPIQTEISRLRGKQKIAEIHLPGLTSIFGLPVVWLGAKGMRYRMVPEAEYEAFKKATSAKV